MGQIPRKITNKNYRNFLDNGLIDPISEDHIKQALRNIKGKHQRQGRALLIALYFTGARPSEVLKITAEDITKKKSYVLIRIHRGSLEQSKNKLGLPRTIYLQSKNPLVRELYDYSMSLFPKIKLFHHYVNNYERIKQTPKGLRTRSEISDKLRYYFEKWFQGVVPHGISPYFLRHSRFSKLSEAGATMEQIRMLKGCRSMESITPYIHMSSLAAKKLAKKMV